MVNRKNHFELISQIYDGFQRKFEKAFVFYVSTHKQSIKDNECCALYTCSELTAATFICLLFNIMGFNFTLSDYCNITILVFYDDYSVHDSSYLKFKTACPVDSVYSQLLQHGHAQRVNDITEYEEEDNWR